MRINSNGAGSLIIDPALFRALLFSLFLHAGLCVSLGVHQSQQNTLLLASPPVLNATLIHSQITPPSIEQDDTLELGTTQAEEVGTISSSIAKNKSDEGGKPSPQSTTQPLDIIKTQPPYYYTHHELDIPPYVLEEQSDETRVPIENEENGKAIADLWINDFGLIDKIELLESDLSDEFKEVVLQTFSKTKFSPGIKDGHSVHSRIRMEILYEPESFRQANTVPKRAPQKLLPP